MEKAAPVSNMETGAFYLETMKALVLDQIGILEFRDIPEPVAETGKVVVRVECCALCRTDAKMWFQGQRDLKLPRVLGHEICGIREDTGERVVVWPAETCGNCGNCLSGQENLCDSIKIIGFNTDGGLAEKLVVHESSVLPIPDTLTADVACLSEPLACSINALKQMGSQRGESLLIFGGGSLGLFLAIAAKASGLRPSIIEPNERKLLKSQSVSDHIDVPVSNSANSNLFDMAINACSSMEAVHQGLTRLRKGGRYCLFSGLNQLEAVPVSSINEIHYRQLHMVGAYGCALSHIKMAIQIIDDYQEVAQMVIERKIGLEGVPGALRVVWSGEALRIVTMMPDHGANR